MPSNPNRNAGWDAVLVSLAFMGLGYWSGKPTSNREKNTQRLLAKCGMILLGIGIGLGYLNDQLRGGADTWVQNWAINLGLLGALLFLLAAVMWFAGTMNDVGVELRQHVGDRPPKEVVVHHVHHIVSEPCPKYDSDLEDDELLPGPTAG